jgi:hypothetical protein
VAKIIINYDDSIDPDRVMELVFMVITEGKISESAGIPHYCWVTTFHDCIVYTLRKKHSKLTDSFKVVKK